MIVFDSWALVAYVNNEPAAARIETEWRAEGAAISSVNLGEVLYIRMRATDSKRARADVTEIRNLLTVIDPDWPMVAAAAEVKAAGGLSYADAFCISAARHLEAPLWTGDPEILEQAESHGCEVVDLR
jgi:predicted nucleic acid-binding protein